MSYTHLSTKQRLDSFSAKRIGHPMMVSRIEELQSLIQNPAGANIALLCGPTGAGKTTLLEIVVDMIHRGELPEMVANPGCLPVVCIKAPAPKGPNFSWKDFCVRVLDAMEEPQVDQKIVTLVPSDLKNARGNHTTLNVDEICRVTERALRLRKTKLLMIDEAQHLHHVAGGRRLLDQLDVLKSFCYDEKLIILLTGTYDLLNMFELNGQLLRRTAIFNFSRYQFDKNFRHFLIGLKAFQGRIPTDEPTNLVAHAEFLFESSVGLVGILKNHLDRALKVALQRKAVMIELKDLQQTALPSHARWKILQEASAGDRFFENLTQTDENIRAALGMEPLVEATKPTAPATQRVGLRKVINDPVGLKDPEAAKEV